MNVRLDGKSTYSQIRSDRKALPEVIVKYCDQNALNCEAMFESGFAQHCHPEYLYD